MIIAMLLIAAAAGAKPSDAAEALGLRLAKAGTLATVAPLLAAKDAEDLVAEHPELSAVDKDALRAAGRRVAAAAITRLNAQFGHAYAERLSLADLRTLVRAAEDPAARRFRAVLPQAMASALTGAGKIDVKAETIAVFCRETGKACVAKPAK